MASEKRLIDANELKSRMFSYYGCVNEHTSKSTYTGETLMDYEVAGLIEDCIDGANTVDAEEVVRCGECDSHEKEACPKGAVWCKTMCRYMKPDGFCSEGRKSVEG